MSTVSPSKVKPARRQAFSISRAIDLIRLDIRDISERIKVAKAELILLGGRRKKTDSIVKNSAHVKPYGPPGAKSASSRRLHLEAITENGFERFALALYP